MQNLTRPAAALALAALPAAAHAQGPEPAGRTAAQVTPYVWLTGFGGTVQPTPASPAFAVTRGVGDLLRDLDGAFFVTGFARSDRVVFVGDFSYAAASRSGLVPTGNPALPAARAEGRFRQTSLTLAGGYRVLQGPRATVDLLAGLRGWAVRPAVAAPQLGLAAERGATFADPIVAARGTARLSPIASALVYVDAGGFGAGSRSTAQLLATLNARVQRRVWLSGGFRYQSVDYRRGGARADVRLGGPLFGATITF